VKWTDEAFDVMVEAQFPSLMNLPDDAAAPAPQGLLGGGASYFAHNHHRDATKIFLKRDFLLSSA
jgi:hypothetical protein